MLIPINGVLHEVFTRVDCLTEYLSLFTLLRLEFRDRLLHLPYPSPYLCVRNGDTLATRVECSDECEDEMSNVRVEHARFVFQQYGEHLHKFLFPDELFF